MDALSYFIAGIMVYISAAVFLLGIFYRIYQWHKFSASPIDLGLFPRSEGGRGLRSISDAVAFPQVFEIEKTTWIVVFLMHAAGLAAFVGHLRLLHEFTPLVAFLGIDGMTAFAHLTGGLFGVVLLVAMVYFLVKRFKSPYKEISVPEDYLLLILLLLIVVMGDHLRFVGDIPVSAYRAYTHSLLTFQPSFGPEIANSGLKGSLVAHVFFANLLFLYFPFSKLMHFVGTFSTNAIKRGA